MAVSNTRSGGLRVAGLFAGIGGIELGFHAAGHQTELLCDIEPSAQAVLRDRFPDVPIVGDVREIESLPPVDVVTAGFPCQDLSQAGRTAGIGGRQSGLVGEVFRLLESAPTPPTWLLLENVPFMLQLNRGEAMRFLADWLEDAGYSWAYRVIDTRAFGIPQRRQRVILLASRTEDPREVLFVGNERPREDADPNEVACGFYWTEGVRGLGWAVDAIPTLKGGSSLGIPSPPAIRLTSRQIATPDLRDAERLQGFPADWTVAAADAARGARWKLVGNAVSVPVAQWVGERLSDPRPYVRTREAALLPGKPWPSAAWGRTGERRTVGLGRWPVRLPYVPLEQFMVGEPVPLSARATAGFLKRARGSSLRFVDGFLEDVEIHLDEMRGTPALFAA